MKKLLTLGAVLLCGFSLAACGSTPSTKPSANEVDGPLTKVGQYTKSDTDDPKVTLLAIKHYNQTYQLNGATVKIKTAKLLQMDATTKKQRADYETNLGQKLGKRFYVYQVEYVLTNTSDQKIASNGFEVINPQGEQLATNDGAADLGASDNLQPKAKKAGTLIAIAKKSDQGKLAKFKIVSPELIDAAGHLTDEAQTIDLHKPADKTSSKTSATSPSNGQSATQASDRDQQTTASSANRASGDDKVIVAGHSFHHETFAGADILVGDNGEGEAGEWAANNPATQNDTSVRDQLSSIYGNN